ncbi:ferredoxin [Candidatus Woesearchaeota archaeon]|nr:ferredoxin [Candidatus Woesearchaeota archaeon]
MAKYKVIFDREICIGALSCFTVNEKFWKIADDGKVDLINAVLNKETNKWELIIDEKDLDLNKKSAEVCPVTAIIIEKISEG